MASPDTCCTLVPYFKVAEGQLAAFKAIGEQFVAKTRSEPGCVHYAFSFSGQEAHCREGYDNAAALLAHLDNVGALLQQALKIAEITRLEVHAPASEIAQLREPMAGLNPKWFELEGGFRR
jgi:quinol monooxygenase YgiN